MYIYLYIFQSSGLQEYSMESARQECQKYIHSHHTSQQT